MKNLHPEMKIIGLTGHPDGSLAEFSDVVLLTGNPAEICPLGLTPTTSTTVMTVVGDVLVTLLMERIGFSKEEQSDAINLVCNLTGDNSREVVSFGTEAGLFQEIGISTVVCGPGSIEQAHSIDEYVSFDQLKKCLALLIQISDFAKN